MSARTLKAVLLAGMACLPASQAAAGGTPIGEPYYAYFLYEYRQVNPAPRVFDYYRALARSGDQHGGTLLQIHPLGDSALGFPADDMVAGYNDGKTFWSQTLSPLHGGSAHDLVGGMSEIYVAQSFRKNTAAATLSFSFTAGRLQLMDYGSGRADYSLAAGTRFAIHVVNHDTTEETFTERQAAFLYEDFGSDPGPLDNTWQLTVTQENGPLSRGLAPWSWQCEECGRPSYGFATANLLAPYSGAIPLDFIAVGAEFTVSFYLMTYALDMLQGETSALAYAKDPVSDGLGVGFEFTGLTPTDQPILTAVPEPHVWAFMALGLGLVGARVRPQRDIA